MHTIPSNRKWSLPVTLILGTGLALALLWLLSALRVPTRAPASPPNAQPAAQSLFPLPSSLSLLTGPHLNGELTVEVFHAGAWHPVGNPPYDQFLAERQLDLPALPLTGQVQVRITHAGDTAAHVDAALIDGHAPSGVGGTAEDAALALNKLAACDYDVIDVQGRTVVLTFDLQDPATALALTARIEPERIIKIPFQFPPENLYQEMSASSSFYTYILDSQPGALQIDGDLGDEGLTTAFFQEFCRTGTGHPSGDTYGWVRNDDRNLYVALDFVPDNTVDGDADYAKVYVNTPDGLRVFRVSVPEQQWGVPGFTYTGRAVYQHKTYEFKIPLAEIGLADPRPGDEIALAFAAYGTSGATPPPYPGPLDPTFGVGGVVTTMIGSAFGETYAESAALQPDGKIVVAGVSGSFSDANFALARYNGDGSLDPGFGVGGIVTTAISSAVDRAKAVAIQDDGKIVVAGYSTGRVVVARYTVTGTLDAGFGAGGLVTTVISDGQDSARDVAIQPDGKIVVAGDSAARVAVLRYNPDGTLDPGFGTAGIVTTSVGASSWGQGVALQDDGKIVVAGGSEKGTFQYAFTALRYNTDGSLDPGFGTGGVVTTTIDDDYGSDVLIQPDGKIVVAGTTETSGGSPEINFAAVRYTVTGTLDTGFGTGGVVTTNFGSPGAGVYDTANAVALQPDGKIVVTGDDQGAMGLVRYNADGSPDATFGTAGKVNLDFSLSTWDEGHDVLVQPDGKIVMVGQGASRFALARYERADFAISKSATPIVVQPGQMVTYTLVFHNSDAVTATDVFITDVLPVTFTVQGIVSTVTPLGSGAITDTGISPPYVWQVADLPPGARGAITLTGEITIPHGSGALQIIANRATIAAAGVPLDASASTSVARITIPRHLLYLPLVLRSAQ